MNGQQICRYNLIHDTCKDFAIQCIYIYVATWASIRMGLKALRCNTVLIFIETVEREY